MWPNSFSYSLDSKRIRWSLAGFFLVVILSACDPVDNTPYLELAKEDLSNERSTSAINNLKRVLQAEPKNLEARLILSKVYIQQGEFRRAVANLDKAAKISPDNTEVLITTGQALMQAGEFRRLLEKVNVTAAMTENHRSDVLGLRSQAYLALGEKEKANVELNKTAKIKESGKEHQLARIQLELSEERMEKAGGYLKKALKEFPYDSQFQLLAAKLEIDTGNISDGTSGFETLMDKKSPGYSSSIAKQSGYELIKTKVSQGEFVEAEKLVRKLLKRDRKDFRALYFGGLVALISGNYGLAERRLVRLEKSYSIESVRLLLGVVFMANKSYERGRFYLENYYGKNRDDIWVAKLLIRTYIILGELKEAQKIFRYIEKENFNSMNDSEILILRSMLLASRGERDLADELLEKATPLVADNQSARKLLSKAYLDIGKPDQSITHAGYVLEQDPIDSEALEISVYAKIQQKDKSGVESQIINFKQAGGDSVKAENLLGLAMLYMGNYGEAEKHFEKILKSEPRQPDARINRVKAIELSGDFLKANDLYSEMLVFPERRPDVLKGLVRTAYLAGDIRRIESAVQISRSYDYKAVEPLLYQGAHFIKQGEFEKANDLVTEIAMLSPDHPADKLLMAGIQLEQKNYEAAELITYKLLSEDPSDEPTLLLMADLQHRSGNEAAASKYRDRTGVRVLGTSAELLGRSGSGKIDWATRITPVLAGHSGRGSIGGKTLTSLLDLDNGEVQLASSRSGLDLADSASVKKYSYGKSGDLARINRTLFFRFYGSFAGGAVGEGEMARRSDKGFFDEYDPENMGTELNQIVNKKKAWGPKSSYRDFKRTLRLPSLVAVIGIVMIFILLGVRWGRSKDRKNIVKDY